MSFYYTSRASFILSGKFLLHIPCWLNFYLGSFSYTSHTGFIFLWGVSLTHSHAGFNYIRWLSLIHRMLALLFCSEFLLHIPCYLYFYAGNFFYTSQPAFIFMRVVSLTYPMQASFYAGSFSYTSRADFFFMWGVCLTHPVLASCLCGEFLLHLPYCFFL